MTKQDFITKWVKNNSLREKVKTWVVVYLIVVVVALFLMKIFGVNKYIIAIFGLFVLATIDIYYIMEKLADYNPKLIEKNSLVILAMSNVYILSNIGMFISFAILLIFDFAIFYSLVVRILFIITTVLVIPIIVSKIFKKKLKY